MAGGVWTIGYAQFPIGRRELGFGFATHGMLVVRDDRGEVAAIYEGLAHGLRRDGSFGAKAIGTGPSDTILFCRDGEAVDFRYRQRDPAGDQTLLSGTEREIAQRMRIAEEIGHRINLLEIGYPPFGIFGFASRNRGFAISNSNAVIATLVMAMGLAQPRPSRLCPGRHVVLLDPAEIAAIGERHRLNEGEVISHPLPHPEVPKRSGGLEGGLQKALRSLEPSFETADAAPQDEGQGWFAWATRLDSKPYRPRP